MESKQARELAARVVSGERLTQADEQELLAWLQQHPEAREAYLADEALDVLLGCLGRLRATEDDFVAATLRRVAKSSGNSAAESPGGGPVAANAAAWPAYDRMAIATRPRFKRSRLFPQLTNWQTLMLICATLLLLASGGGFLLLREQSPFAAHHPPGKDGRENRLPPLLGFAQLEAMDGAAMWETPLAVGARLTAGPLKLATGVAEIRFDKGTVARVTGPAVIDLRSPDEMLLSRGSLAARVPASAIGFTVTTPVGRVVDLGTEFDVSVNDSGNAEARVRVGKISFQPQRAGELPGKPLELTADGLDRAVTTVPDIAAPVLPVCTLVSSSQGEFVGTICANGKTMEFVSREAFEESRAVVLKQLREAPNEFSERWSIMVVETTAQGAAGASVSAGGSVRSGTVLGPPGTAKFPTGLPNAREMLREQLRQQRKDNAGNPQMQELLEKLLHQLEEDN
jgi:ferric-dicitrate binding protein FerR (iron transport regulator)